MKMRSAAGTDWKNRITEDHTEEPFLTGFHACVLQAPA